MKLKTKMLKNLISVLCAATIATSGVVTSVSAGNTVSSCCKKKGQPLTKKDEFKMKYDEAKSIYDEIVAGKHFLDKTEENRLNSIEMKFIKLSGMYDEIVDSKNDDKILEAIAKVDKLKKDMAKLLSVEKLDVVLKEIEEFKKDFEAKKANEAREKEAKEKQEKEKAAINITDDKFEELLAGDQHVGNERVVDGKEWKIENTCGVHMLTTLKNIYDYMDGKPEGPVKGFNNVIDNYLANGGTKDRLFAKNERGRLGEPLDVNDFKGFLGKNKIGMQQFSFYQIINAREEAKKANKQEWDVVQEYKDKLKNQIKSFLISYMKGKNFAPIGTVGGGHWTLLAKYDEKTNKILRLDSSPAEAVWVNIDTIADNFIHVDPWDEGNYGIDFEMPIFTRTEGIKDVPLDSDSFAEQKQNELIKRIG